MNGWQTLLKKEVLRFWKVSFQTVAAPVLTAVLYLLIFGHVLEGRVLVYDLSLIHISEPTRLGKRSYAVFCLKTKNPIS